MYILIVTILSALVIAGGTICSLIPILPGPPITLAGLLLYGWLTGFQFVSLGGLAVVGMLTLLSVLFDIFGPAITAKGYKASKSGMYGALIGGVVGVIVLGPLGAFLGPFFGAFLGEFLTQPDQMAALRVAWGALVGLLIGTFFRFIVSMVIAAYFLFAAVHSLAALK